ncbi:MAG: hypothetical protein ABIP17_01295 [Ilumatobacteraceae bacterium]
MALIVVTGFVVGAVAMFWVRKTVVEKPLVVVTLALLAFTRGLDAEF